MRSIYSCVVVTQSELDENEMHPGIGFHTEVKDGINYLTEYELPEEDENSDPVIKTSKRLTKVIDGAIKYMNAGKGYNTKKFNTKTWQAFQRRFNESSEKIGGVDYTLGDCIA